MHHAREKPFTSLTLKTFSFLIKQTTSMHGTNISGRDSNGYVGARTHASRFSFPTILHAYTTYMTYNHDSRTERRFKNHGRIEF